LKLLPTAEVFHFAGHAVVRGYSTGLLLASAEGEAAWLDSSYIKKENLKKLQLAVLSGCETALADQGMVDAGNLVRAFLRSGVPSVVASKWRVDSTVSSDTMQRFYADVLRGYPVAQALGDSERSIRSNARTAHPYYWAAFSSFGG
jgi:CHAT domain-containing protein